MKLVFTKCVFQESSKGFEYWIVPENPDIYQFDVVVSRFRYVQKREDRTRHLGKIPREKARIKNRQSVDYELKFLIPLSQLDELVYISNLPNVFKVEAQESGNPFELIRFYGLEVVSREEYQMNKFSDFVIFNNLAFELSDKPHKYAFSSTDETKGAEVTLSLKAVDRIKTKRGSYILITKGWA